MKLIGDKMKSKARRQVFVESSKVVDDQVWKILYRYFLGPGGRDKIVSLTNIIHRHLREKLHESY